MTKLKTIIADDVSEYNELLIWHLDKYCPNVEVVGEATSLEQTYDLVKELQPDLLFLDIDFNDELSFTLLERLKQEKLLNFQLIFLTGFVEKEYYINAFKYSALQYINKPIEPQLLIETVNRAMEVLNSKQESQVSEQYDVMMFNMKAKPGSQVKQILLKQIKKQYLKADLSDIMYLHSDTTMTVVYLKNETKIMTVELIGAYDYLTDLPNFFRISQSCIVNLDFATKYLALEKKLVLENGIFLTVSRQKDRELRRWFRIL